MYFDSIFLKLILTHHAKLNKITNEKYLHCDVLGQLSVQGLHCWVDKEKFKWNQAALNSDME